MRSKEDAQDYRYFPEPDLVPIVISDEWLEAVKERQPEFRDEKKARYIEEYKLPEYDADIITQYKKMADIFEKASEICKNPKKVSNYLMGETMRLLKDKGMDPDEISFSPENLAGVITLVEKGVINGNVAKEVFAHVFEEDVNPEKYVEEHGLKMESNEDEIQKIVEEVVAANPQSVEDYKNGKEKAIGFLVGQTMKAAKGKANPGIVNQLLKDILSR